MLTKISLFAVLDLSLTLTNSNTLGLALHNRDIYSYKAIIYLGLDAIWHLIRSPSLMLIKEGLLGILVFLSSICHWYYC